MNRPGAIGTLSIRSVVTPDNVSAAALRNLTNLDDSFDSLLENRGENSGRRFNYVEGSIYF